MANAKVPQLVVQMNSNNYSIR